MSANRRSRDWPEAVMAPQSPNDFKHKNGRKCKYSPTGWCWMWEEGVCALRHDGSS